ncbi:Flagellar motor switch protein FliG [Buchnera aphidicola (Anoecia corni)]|uniref:Flagellar motor switch protein FliG n=1 Tax=Buchnera aphidicola (Anoecia corni) TaxID=2994477 RepID=A0AAT9IFZ3_9GAMM
MTNLNGKQKIAYLLLQLDTNISSKILKHFNKQEIEEIVFHISNIKKVNTIHLNNVIKEYFTIFNKICSEKNTIDVKIFNMLKKTIGIDDTNLLLNKIKSKKNYSNIQENTINELTPKNINLILENENIEIIATILINLKTKLASEVLSTIKNEEQQADIILYIASYTSIPESSKPIFTQLIRELFHNKTLNLNKRGGTKRAANILQTINSEKKEIIIKNMRKKNTVLTINIINKIFLFENIIDIKDVHINKLLKLIPIKTLSIALYNSEMSVRNKFLKNLSDNSAKEMKNYFNEKKSLSLTQIKNAQEKILHYLKKII